jgi:hypothetical protein
MLQRCQQCEKFVLPMDRSWIQLRDRGQLFVPDRFGYGLLVML